MTYPKHTLQAQSVFFSYDEGKPVLNGIDLAIEPGTHIAVLGPNGSGKTTLLRCLLGFLEPQKGKIILDQVPITQCTPKIVAKALAYVPQFPNAAFAFPIRELVLMGRFAHAGFLGMTSAQDRAVAELAMEMTETTEFATRTLNELSGGEAQRVMVARALAQQPSVMLLDEPTSHLDLSNQLKITKMLGRLAHDWNMAVLAVSHDINLAARFADELVFMKKGRIVAQGPPESTLDKELLGDIYEMDIDLLTTDNGLPIVKPW